MSKKSNIVFVLKDNRYIELPYSELVDENGKRSEKYLDKHFIPLHGYLMEVSLEEYKSFYKSQRRQKYLKELSIQNKEVSFDSLKFSDYNNENDTTRSSTLTEDIVEKKIASEKLKEILFFLEENECQLIHEIFYENKSERELALKYCISQAALHKRKDKILKKLKNLYNF